MTATSLLGDKTISDRLTARGLAHQPGENGRRYVSGPSGPLGLMSAEEVVNLLALLEALDPK